MRFKIVKTCQSDVGARHASPTDLHLMGIWINQICILGEACLAPTMLRHNYELHSLKGNEIHDPNPKLHLDSEIQLR